MAKTGRSLADLVTEIERRANSKKDFNAPVPKLAVELVNGAPCLAIANGGTQSYALTDYAHGQLAEYVGIPKAYYDRCRNDAPAELAAQVNRWLKDHAAEARMVRVLDDECRALVSTKFRRDLENEDQLQAALPVLRDRGLQVISCDVTPTRMYLKAVDKEIRRDIPTGRTMGDGTHTIFDTISPAVSFGNSEVGAGSMFVESSVLTWACTNLATTGVKQRRFHVGMRAEASTEVYEMLTDETKAATDAATLLQVRDMIGAAFDLARFDAHVMKLNGATQDKLPPKDVVEVVTRAARKLNLTEVERDGVLGMMLEGGDFTRYGLHAAVTRYSQDDAVGYDRATELEAVGGDVIDLAPSAWRELVAA